MQRIDPTIGNTDLDADPAAAAEALALAKSRRTRKAVQEWFVTTLMFSTLAVGGAWFASRAGLIPEQFKFGATQLFQRLLIVLGLFVAFLAQLIGTILLFRRSFVQGGLSLFVPGYIFFALKRNALYGPVIGTLCVGLLAVVAGTILLA